MHCATMLPMLVLPGAQPTPQADTLVVLFYAVIAPVTLSIGIAGLVKWLVAGLFGFRSRYGRLVMGTNLLIQLAAWGFFYTSLFLRLGISLEGVLLLPLVAVSVECLVYCAKMRDVSGGKCLVYTLVANAISLAAVLLVYATVLEGF